MALAQRLAEAVRAGFARLWIASHDHDDAVAEAQRIVRGVAPQKLRDREGLRRTVAARLGRVQTQLDQLMVERPRRRINWTGGPS